MLKILWLWPQPQAPLVIALLLSAPSLPCASSRHEGNIVFPVSDINIVPHLVCIKSPAVMEHLHGRYCH